MRWRDIDFSGKSPLQYDTVWWRKAAFVPAPFFNRIKKMRIAVMALAVLAVLIYVVVQFGSYNSRAGFIVLGMNIIYLPMWVLWPRVAFAGLCRELMDADCRHCLGCGYRLTGLPDHHRCPECGRTFEIEAVRQAWTYWIREKRLPEGSWEQETK